MGRRPAQHFFSKEDIQVANRYKKRSKPQWDITLYLSEWISKTNKQIRNNKRWKGCRQTGTILHCWWKCKLVQPLWKTVQKSFKKLKIELLYYPEIPHLGMDLKKTKTPILKDICTSMFTETIYNNQDKKATSVSIVHG